MLGVFIEVVVILKLFDIVEIEIEENSRGWYNKKIDGDVGEICCSKRSFMVY